jgi:rod shape-determining protein MreC
VDTAAVGAAGLVGRVISTDLDSAWLELITHPVAAVAVCTPDGGVHGLAEGAGPNRLAVRYIPRSAEILRGTELVTSGADGVYPPGLPVGRVAWVRESDDPFLTVTATPSARLANLRIVLLLPQWTSTEDPGEAP